MDAFFANGFNGTGNINNANEYFMRLNNLLSNIELILKKCSKKYKDKCEVENLYTDLMMFINQENLNDSKYQDEFNLIEKEFKRTNNFSETNRKMLNDYKEKFKHLSIELKSSKTMLEKSNISWDKFMDSFEIIDKWLEDQEHTKSLADTDINNYQRYQKLYTQFNESANFLLQTSDLPACSKIKDRLLHLNKRWKIYQDRFKDTQYEQLLKFYECEHSLNMVKERLNKIESLMNKQLKSNLISIGKYQEELQKAFNDVECLDANLKLLQKLTGRLDLDKNSMPMSQFLEDIGHSENRLLKYRQQMPDFLKNLTKVYTNISKIEECIQKIENWISEGECLLRVEADMLNFEQILSQIERQKIHFIEYNNYENVIREKRSILDNFKSLITPNIDQTELISKLNKTKECLEELNQKRFKWENSFQTQQNTWKSFHLKTKDLEEWIMKAQMIVCEKNDDYNFLIHKHKDFFENVNNAILQGFLENGQKLLRIKNENDRLEIKNLMDTLEGQWKMILSHAPIRLLKLQFKRLEILLINEIKEADAEINEEFNALNENKNLTEIRKRHEAKFKNSDFFKTCESYLNGLKICTQELAEKKVEDKSNIEEIFDYLQNYWQNLTQKIETMNSKLTILPDTKENFQLNINQLTTWLLEIEFNTENLFKNHMVSTSEYKRFLDKSKILLGDLDLRREKLKTCLAQCEYLSNQQALPNVNSKSQIIDIHQRFNNVLSNLEKIEKRNNFLDKLLKVSAQTDEISNKIRDLSTQSARRFMAEEDESSLHMALNDHKSILDQLYFYDAEMNQLIAEIDEFKNETLPIVVADKLSSVHENLRQIITEETERHSSLLEIKQATDQKLIKFNLLKQNLDTIKKILHNKKVDLPEESNTGQMSRPSSRNNKSFLNKSAENSLNYFNNSLSLLEESDIQGGVEASRCNLKQRHYAKFLIKLNKCKEIISNSKKTMNELKFPMGSMSLNASTGRTPTPSHQDFNELRELEQKFDSYEHDIDIQVDIFEQNLTKQAKIDKNFEDLNLKLLNIQKRFEEYYLHPSPVNIEKVQNLSEIEVNQSTHVLESDYNKAKIDLDQIENLNEELNMLTNEKCDLLREDNRNLNRSRIGTLQMSFNETIFELDLEKDNEITVELNKFKNELDQMKEKCSVRLNELKFKMEQKNINKKQKKLNFLRETLDLQLDTLVSLKMDRLDEDLRKSMQEELDEFDLAKESEQILLEKVNFDETNNTNLDKSFFKTENSEEKSVLSSNSNNDNNINNKRRLSRSVEKFEETDHQENKKQNRSLSTDGYKYLVHSTENYNLKDKKQIHLTKSNSEKFSSIDKENKEPDKINKDSTEVSSQRDLKKQQNQSKEHVSKIPVRKSDDKRAKKLSSKHNRTNSVKKTNISDAEDSSSTADLISTSSQSSRQSRSNEKIASRSNLVKTDSRSRSRSKNSVRFEIDSVNNERNEIKPSKEENMSGHTNKLSINEAYSILPCSDSEEYCEEINEDDLINLKNVHEASTKLVQEDERKFMEHHDIIIPIIEESPNYDVKSLNRNDDDGRIEHVTVNYTINDNGETIIEENQEIIEEYEEEDKNIEKYEIEILERELKERERIDKIEKEIAQRAQRGTECKQMEKQQMERIELERSLELEKFENEKKRIEEERQAERERYETQKIENDRKKLEREKLAEQKRLKLEQEKIERMERETHAENNIRLEQERKQIELTLKLENEKRERERLQKKLEDELAEKERIAQQLIEKENKELELQIKLEKRLELERQQQIEIERIKNLELERIELERIKREKEENETRERMEHRKRLEQAELESIENEKRVKHEQLEIERIKHEKKLKLDYKLKEMSENFNNLKERINQLNSFENEYGGGSILNMDIESTQDVINSLREELVILNDQIDSLSIENGLLNNTGSSNSLFGGLDQAAQTQFNLIKSFSSYVNTQLELKKENFLKIKLIRSKLLNYESNLEKFIELGLKYLNESNKSDNENNVTYVENIEDLNNRIESIKSIEDSIQNCLSKICELNSDIFFYSEQAKYRSKYEIESKILQPLSSYRADLKQFMLQWKEFSNEFSMLKRFLNEEIQIEQLQNESKNRYLDDRNFKENLDLEAEFQHYALLRNKVNAYLSESNGLFERGVMLLNPSTRSQRFCIQVPNASKDFSHTSEMINETCKYLEEKYTSLGFACRVLSKIRMLDADLEKIKSELNEIENEKTSISQNTATNFKLKLEKTNNLKKRLKTIVNEKNNTKNLLDDDEPNICKLEKLTDGLTFLPKNNLEKSIDNTMMRLNNIENEFQEKVMRSLPSRNSLQELQEWLRFKLNLIEGVSKELSIEKQSLNQLYAYKNQLLEINDEIIHERESSLKYVRNSIDNEIKQGFYDLHISEECTQMERDWSRLKQKLSSDLERLDINLSRCTEFEKSIEPMLTWVDIQTQKELENIIPTENNYINEVKCLNTIEDDKHTMKQIAVFLESLEKLNILWKSQDKNDKTIIGQIVQKHVEFTLDDLNEKMYKIELITKLKIESNLSQLKQNFATKMNELNGRLETEVNFLNHGKIASLKQYENSIKEIKEIQSKLMDARSQMQALLTKFETELKSGNVSIDLESMASSGSSSARGPIKNVLNIVKNKINSYDLTGLLENNDISNKKSATILSNLSNKNLENAAQNLVSQAEKEILPIWIKYDALLEKMQTRIAETKRSILSDLENIEQIVQKSAIDSNLYQQTLEDMLENKRLFKDYDSMSMFLIEKFIHNENTKLQLESNKFSLQQKFENLSELAESLKIRLEELSKEHKNYLILIEATCAFMKKAQNLLNSSVIADDKIDSMTNNTLKQNAIDLEAMENVLSEQLNKFKELNANNSERISKIYEVTNPCSNLLTSLRDARLNILDFIQERNYVLSIKLNDIGKYLDGYIIKCNVINEITQCSKNKSVENLKSDGLCSEEIVRVINCIKYMINNDLELNKCQKLLKELEAQSNDESQQAQINNFKKKISQYKLQIKSLTSKPNSMYNLVVRLKELNEELFNRSVINKSEYTIKIIQENFLKLKIELEKELGFLEEQNFHLIDLNTFKIYILDPIDRFYKNLVGDVDSMQELRKSYTSLSKKIENYLREINTKLVDFMNTKVPFPNKEACFDLIEKKSHQLRELKLCLADVQFKADMDLIQRLEIQLNTHHHKSKVNADNDMKCLNFDSLKIKYLDLSCQIDKELKFLESESNSFRLVASNTQKMLDIIKQSYKALADISMSNKPKMNKIISKSSPQKNKVKNEDKTNRIDEFCFDVGCDSLTHKIEFKNDKTLNQLIDMVKIGVLENLNKHEYLKEEIYRLDKSESVKLIVDKINIEWKLVKEKAQAKLNKLENFKTKLNELDVKLNLVRDQIFSWETYLNHECFSNLDLTTYDQILSKKNELEEILESLNKREAETQQLFKAALSANGKNMNGNRKNQIFIQNTRERWSNLKSILKEKICLIENAWIMLSDLNDQIENFYSVLNKTEQFYRNTVLASNIKTNLALKIIAQLYQTIKEDYKLIKYLNKSYVNFSKLLNNFELFKRLETLKKPILELNSRWDNLHNEISIKIKMTRQQEHFNDKTKACSLSKDKLLIWMREISLLLTNLEHVSTMELQLKCADVQDLKKEICDQTEVLLRNEHILKNDTVSIDQLKEIMKRVLRLDSYLQQSLPFHHRASDQNHINKQNYTPQLGANGGSNLAYCSIML